MKYEQMTSEQILNLGALLEVAPHYRPIIRAWQAGTGLGLLRSLPAGLVSSDRLGPTNRWIAFVVDDEGPAGSALGPSRFNEEDLTSLLMCATHLAVYSGLGEERFYKMLALPTQIGGRVVVVETQVERHHEWVAEVKRVSKAPLLVIHPDGALGL